MGLTEELRRFRQANPRELRRFGLTVGAVFTGLGGWALWRGSGLPPYLFALAAILLAGGLLAPAWLQLSYRGWMTVALLLGWVMTRVLLSVCFYLVVTPLALAARLVGKNFLSRRFDRAAGSYWVVRAEGEATRQGYERQF